MYFDYFTTTALVDELKTTIVDGRVQDIIEVDDLSLGFEVYANHARRYLYMTADPDQPRLHLTDGKLRRGVTVSSPLGLMLNRYIEGGLITAIRQPAWERIVIFDIATAEGEYSLIVEPIERRANIVLVQDGIIRECIRRVSGADNRVRQLLPGQPYHFPPPQEKRAPQDINIIDVKQFDPDNKLSGELTKRVYGFSPLLAKEVAYRAAGDVNAKTAAAKPQTIVEALQAVVMPLVNQEWSCGYVVEDEEVVAFAVYPLTQYENWQRTETVSAAIEAFYGIASGERAYDAARVPIRKQLKRAEDKLRGKLHSLKRQERDDSEIERLRQSGELLLAYQHEIEPQQILYAAQYDPESDPIQIKLDPLLTAVENAQRYFEKYEKGKRSRASLPDLILETEREIRYLGQLETDLDLAANWDDIGEVQDALIAAGYWQGKRRRQTGGAGKSAPMKFVTDDGWVIWVGRNSRQNEEVTFTKGASEDLWLHVRGMPGAHVVIKNSGRAVSDETLLQAAELAAYYSKGREETSVEVLVTQRKYVQKIKGGKMGMVKVTNQTHPSLNVTPRNHNS